eukprot:SAG11_NODE_652_length_7925_cov_3.950166_12_plen_92_part_00
MPRTYLHHTAADVDDPALDRPLVAPGLKGIAIVDPESQPLAGLDRAAGLGLVGLSAVALSLDGDAEAPAPAHPLAVELERPLELCWALAKL